MLPAHLVTAIAFAAVLPAAPSDPALPPPVPVSPGQVVKRALATGETHRYEVAVRAGEYLQVDVEQDGVDVAETLVDPEGRTVLESDITCASNMPDPPTAVVASLTGTYTLIVREAADAGLRWPPQSYELRVVAVREPGALDLARIAAVRANARASALVATQPAAALPHLFDAASSWATLGDRRLLQCTESMIGGVYWKELDRFPEASEWFRRAVETAVEAGDESAEASVRINLAQVLRRLGRPDDANTELERALALHRAAGRNTETTRALKVLGALLIETGETQAALDRLHEGLQIARAEGDAWGEGQARLGLGAAYLAMGDADLALEHLRLAFPLLDTPLVRALALRDLGAVHFLRGDLARAREAYGQSLAMFAPLANRIHEAATSLRLGELHLVEGELRKAEEVFTSALAVFQDRNYPLGQGRALCLRGETRRRLGDLGASRTSFEGALALAPQAGASVHACAEEGLARAARDARDLEEARRHAEAALAQAESQRADVASDRLRATSLAASQPLYELLVDIHMRRHEARPAGGHDVAAFEVAERARARTLLELLRETAVDVRRGVAPDLLADERSLRRRFNTTAAARAEAREAGRAPGIAALERDLDALSVELAEVEGRIRRASPHYAALTQPQPLGLADIRARVLDGHTQLLQYLLGDERSMLWVVSGDRVASFRLAPRLEIENAARRLHELMSAPGASGEGPELEAARSALSRLVLAPAASALTARRLLVVAPGALQTVPLGGLPLPDGTPVLARFEVVSAPSASVIATIRDEARGRDRPAGTAAVFADPVFDRSDPRIAADRRADAAAARTAPRGTGSDEPVRRAIEGLRGRGPGGGLGRLPFSRREAEAITALASPARAWKATGFEASREAVTSARLADYRIVHFATHGVLNTRRPELSGVVLSLFDERGRKQDGFLRLHDVYNLRLDADLVVLSGCQTALGKDLRGEGLVGLTRGFMYAGARAVVASLWQVDDESTAELMKLFYRGMLKEGRRPADALRAAQLEMSRSRRWSAPFHWAGFVLQGEWR